MKSKLLFIILSTFILNSFAFAGDFQKKYIKGNMAEKTEAVRESSGTDEGLALSNSAILFALENKDILGPDRDLEALVIAAVLSLPADYGRLMNDEQRANALGVIMTLYNKFEDSPNVQIAILNKIGAFQRYLPVTKFTDFLNMYLVQNDIRNEDPSKVKEVFSSLSQIGNNGTFVLLYNYVQNNKYPEYIEDITNTLVELVPSSINSIINIIEQAEFKDLANINALVQKNENISSKFRSEIAENVLRKSILYVEDSQGDYEEIINIQMESLKALNDSKWTKASSTVLAFFDIAKIEYKNKLLSDEQMSDIIEAVGNISPIDSVLPLVNYLGELNLETENKIEVSEEIVLSLINTLGAIGNKSAFDSLLSVTYLKYPESILSAARQALAGLKW